VLSTSLVKLMANAAEHVLPFDALDAMLALERPDGARGAVMLAEPLGAMSAGTVLDVEGCSATRYGSLRAWLAMPAAMLGTFAGPR
jgi:hypothetical protein